MIEEAEADLVENIGDAVSRRIDEGIRPVQRIGVAIVDIGVVHRTAAPVIGLDETAEARMIIARLEII